MVLTIGILGDGQLARMLKEGASILGLDAHSFGTFDDLVAFEAFLKTADIVTYEFENIPDTILQRLEGCAVFPDVSILYLTRDRLFEKEKVRALGLETAPFVAVESINDVLAREDLLPGIVKTRRLGYDGKGQLRVDAASLEREGHKLETLLQNPCILEKEISFTYEVSVIVARGRDGQMACYEPTRTVHKNHILHETFTPSGLPSEVMACATQMAQRIVQELDYVGVMGVELFYCQQNETLLINELAPRVHNSGHWTQDACTVSQFEQHIRAIVGLPLASTKRHSDAHMINLLGADVYRLQDAFTQPFHHVHLYGKEEARAGRKMGHVNIIVPCVQP